MGHPARELGGTSAEPPAPLADAREDIHPSFCEGLAIIGTAKVGRAASRLRGSFVLGESGSYLSARPRPGMPGSRPSGPAKHAAKADCLGGEAGTGPRVCILSIGE